MISSDIKSGQAISEPTSPGPKGTTADLEFDSLGSRIRVLVDPSANPDLGPPGEAAGRVKEFIERFDATLSRFRPESELSAFNSDPRETVPASELLRRVVRAGTDAARYSGGLVDPTLWKELEGAGYVGSRAGMKGLPTDQLLEHVNEARAASASDSRRYEFFEVDDDAETITRPPGTAFDPGGVGKGLAADMAAELLEGYPRYLVSCGGDIRVGGSAAPEGPFDVFIEHPTSGRKPHVFRLGSGGIATSGIAARSWRNPDGSVAHHLLDPSSGKPCRTGLIGATALAPTALEAEVLAKWAVLAGPVEGLELLGRNGGLVVHRDGQVEIAGEARVRFRLPAPDHGSEG